MLSADSDDLLATPLQFLKGVGPRRAADLARAVTVALDVEGLLAVEMFVVGGEVLVNELSPRPHNTYHASETACATSQFEQLVRAVCDLPLGDAAATRPTAIANLLGDLWLRGTPDLAGALAVPGVSIRLYGKAPRPGRKLGHLLASGATSREALRRVRLAQAVLEGRPASPGAEPADGAGAEPVDGDESAAG